MKCHALPPSIFDLKAFKLNHIHELVWEISDLGSETNITLYLNTFYNHTYIHVRSIYLTCDSTWIRHSGGDWEPRDGALHPNFELHSEVIVALGFRLHTAQDMVSSSNSSSSPLILQLTCGKHWKVKTFWPSTQTKTNYALNLPNSCLIKYIKWYSSSKAGRGI